MWGDVRRCEEMWDMWDMWDMWGGREVGNMGLRDVRYIGSEYRIGEMGKCAILPVTSPRVCGLSLCYHGGTLLASEERRLRDAS